MLDVRFIRDNLETVRQNCHDRGVSVDLDRFVELDERRRELLGEQQALRERRNQLAKDMKGRKPTDEERELGKELKTRDADLETELARVTEEFETLHRAIPNMTHPSSPVGMTDDDHHELRRVGTIPQFDFPPLDHVALADKHDLVDFEGGARVTGQKWYFLKNELVLLEQALVRFALDYLRQHDFTLFQTPDLARTQVADGLGFNPRGEETNTYSIEGDDLVLVGTAEITLGGLHADQILDEAELPLRYCGLSHCFRVEAGAAGRAGKGLYRVHQFTKVEMFAFVHPDASAAMHDEMLAHEEALWQALEVPYRVVDICTGDLGAPAYRKFDLEAWMPGRGEGGSFGEITSTSNCTDYQARRLGIRFRDAGTKKTRFVHMLNGTAISLARALLTLMEIGQQQDGSIAIPKALQPYTGFDRIG